MRVGGADTQISLLTEDVVRKVSRRQALIRGVKGMSAVVAGLSVGSLIRTEEAFAACSCSCTYPGCGHCSCRGKTCPFNGCPSGCIQCTSTDCPGTSCIYGDANWICCFGCGQGSGFYRCWDCRCTGCGTLCGCKSGCLCSGCRTAEDVKAYLDSERELALAG